MSAARKPRVLSIRTGEELLTLIEDFRRAQIAPPTQTAAIQALVKIGFDRVQTRKTGAPGRTRTCDLRITNPALSKAYHGSN